MNYRIGLPYEGHWREMLNSDASAYGGSGMGNFGGVMAEARRRTASPPRRHSCCPRSPHCISCSARPSAEEAAT